MSSFFTTPASQKKRKRTDDRAGSSVKRRGVERRTGRQARPTNREQRNRAQDRDESISGSESGSDEVKSVAGSESEATSEEDETAAERRVRLAQRYLDNLRGEIDEVGFDAEEIDKDLIAERLKKDVDEQKGRQFRQIASRLDFEGASHSFFRADTQATTAVAVSRPFAYTVSKDKTLIKWEIIDPQIHKPTNTSQKSPPIRRKPKQLAYVRGVKIDASASHQQGHTGAILSLAVSPDGKYVATGGVDKKIIIWAGGDLRPIKTFTTHRDAVTGLDFAPTSSQSGFGAQLFSASMDRSLKTYSLAGEESLAYVETLFGHQDHVSAVSVMAMDQCVSVGARDRTARLWRVVDETQLKFLGNSSKKDIYHTGSIDCVAALPPTHFVTGSDSGAISLWSIHKKKALFTVHTAHGVDEPPPLDEVTSESDPTVIADLKKSDTRKPQARSITALAALPGTDIVLSGSWDGHLRVWRLSEDKRSLLSLGTVSEPLQPEPLTNGHAIEEDANMANGAPDHDSRDAAVVKGVINSIALFERRKEVVNEFGGKKEGDCIGLCIVAGTGKEMKLGRWKKFPGGKNGAIVFEVTLKA